MQAKTLTADAQIKEIKRAPPKPSLSLFDATALIVGVVIGVGIFETPALVAANSSSGIMMLSLWFLGGIISLIGALCYAELATAYPDAGGTYHYLKKALGKNVAFLFAWSRMTVIQTGSIALLAFIFGDYLAQIWNFGPASSALYAAAMIIIFTALNLLGVRQGKTTQNVLTLAQILGLMSIVYIGVSSNTISTLISTSEPLNSKNIGLAMVFVLLSYGGWNEAAFISAEIKNRDRNILRSLVLSLSIITLIYLLINFAMLRGLGLENMAESSAVAATLLRQSSGEMGAIFISILVAICALGSSHATIFTGARTNYALSQDFRLFRFMDHWQEKSSTPQAALLCQALIALALVFLGSMTRNGFETMVEYTAPVFWFFFLLSGLALIVLRKKEPHQKRPFRVPLYPLTPLCFIFVCAYLLYSSLVYTGIGALVGISLVALGLPILWLNQKMFE
ncbi:MAG: APC family permease [Oligoflexus sp.]